jgi:hypothetical protein
MLGRKEARQSRPQLPASFIEAKEGASAVSKGDREGGLCTDSGPRLGSAFTLVSRAAAALHGRYVKTGKNEAGHLPLTSKDWACSLGLDDRSSSTSSASLERSTVQPDCTQALSYGR